MLLTGSILQLSNTSVKRSQLIGNTSNKCDYSSTSKERVVITRVIEDKDLYFFPFNTDLELAEVILVVKSDLQLSNIQTLIARKYPTAIAFKARLAFGSFSILPDERSVP